MLSSKLLLMVAYLRETGLLSKLRTPGNKLFAGTNYEFYVEIGYDGNLADIDYGVYQSLDNENEFYAADYINIVDTIQVPSDESDFPNDGAYTQLTSSDINSVYTQELI